MRLIPENRALFLLIFIAASGAMLVALLYFQYFLQLEACPLCILQRVAMIAISIFAIVAVLHQPGRVGYRIYGLLVTLSAAGGAGLAIRHLWLQSLPEDQIPECAPPLDYMLETLPLGEVLAIMLRGTGDCSEVLWSFLGLSIPGWTLVTFVALGGMGLYALVRTPRE
jgi:disulfide bond formation protein DsbB